MTTQNSILPVDNFRKISASPGWLHLTLSFVHAFDLPDDIDGFRGSYQILNWLQEKDLFPKQPSGVFLQKTEVLL